MARILVVDDEQAIRESIKEILVEQKYEVDTASDGSEALKKLKESSFEVVISDLRMTKMGGMELLKKAKEQGFPAEFIMITAYGDMENAMEATRLGAFDFLGKPPELQHLLVKIRNAVEKSSMVIENTVLRKQLKKNTEIIGESAPIQRVKRTIAQVAATEARVLITGPNGSGKEMVAKNIHQLSLRVNNPLVEVNCAAIPSELIESELFGHEKGSFTSAVKQRIGKFEQATGGTLFLDEIGDMSLSAQAKVLRALQEGKITRVGGDKEIKVNVRIIAATNKDLHHEIREGNFREDLFHRLNVIPIHVPPLSERKEDIGLLVTKFLADIAEDYGATPKIVSPEGLAHLKELPWTGNVRELRNVIERLVIMCGYEITLEDVKLYASLGV